MAISLLFFLLGQIEEGAELLTAWEAKTKIDKIHNTESKVTTESDWETKNSTTSIIWKLLEAVGRTGKKFDRAMHDLRKLVRLV